MQEQTREEKYSEYLKSRFQPKEEFIERMQTLLGKEGAEEFFEISYTKCPTSIRVNTLKITVEELKKRLAKYNWQIEQPFTDFPEIMVVSNLQPGDIGNAKEHILGYYYVQEISSMLPMLTLQPQPGETILDLCAAPGSKTTQAAAMMQNAGLIIANELSMGRVGILNSNLERCGVTNAIITRKEGTALCKAISKKTKLQFDKIVVDAPCSGEGTLRKSPKTMSIWNKNMIKKIANTQKKLATQALELLKIGGEMIYSTCTLAPEENEMIVDYLLKHYDIEIQKINLPLVYHNGITTWEGIDLSVECEKCLRLYPQDNNTDGFFVTKIKKISNKYTE